MGTSGFLIRSNYGHMWAASMKSKYVVYMSCSHILISGALPMKISETLTRNISFTCCTVSFAME